MKKHRWFVARLGHIIISLIAFAASLSCVAGSLSHSPPHLSTAKWRSDGRFEFSVNGLKGQRYVIEKSSDLRVWTGLFTSYQTSNTVSIIVSVEAGLQAELYRLEEVDEDFALVTHPRQIRSQRVSCNRVAVGAVNDYKPCVAQLPNGELIMCGFRGVTLTNGLYEEDILFWRSSNGGITWSEARNMGSELGLLGREPYLTVLGDGTILMTVHVLSEDYRNTDGYYYALIYRSTDAGKTWAGTRIGPEGLPPRASTLLSRNAVELESGEIVLGVSVLSLDGTRNEYVWRSADRGETWDRKRPCQPVGFKSQFGFFAGEAVLWVADSGKIWAFVRVDSQEYPIEGVPRPDGNGDNTDHLVLYYSTDQGLTFTRDRDLGQYGEMYPSVVRLRDGRLLLTFTVRDLVLWAESSVTYSGNYAANVTSGWSLSFASKF